MGFMEKLLGGRESRTTSDYVELDIEDLDGGATEAVMQIHIAEIDGKEHVIDIKDAVYDGDVVIADITSLMTQDRTVEHIVDELRQVAREVDGDIVQKGDDQLIVTPTGVRISRQKLGKQ
ncbi:MAG: cell division protein SepF [Halobacteriales archaeon]